MSMITKVTYRNRRYMVVRNGLTKRPLRVESWRGEDRRGHGASWVVIWPTARAAAPGPIARVVIALAERTNPL